MNEEKYDYVLLDFLTNQSSDNSLPNLERKYVNGLTSNPLVRYLQIDNYNYELEKCKDVIIKNYYDLLKASKVLIENYCFKNNPNQNNFCIAITRLRKKNFEGKQNDYRLFYATQGKHGGASLPDSNDPGIGLTAITKFE